MTILITQLTEAGTTHMPTLLPAQCAALPLSKTYLSDLQSSQVINFQCQYKCLDNENNEHLISAVHSVDRSHITDEMSTLVCKGVDIKAQVSSLGYVLDQDIYVYAFWAPFTTDMPEITDWVETQNVFLDKEVKSFMRKNMNQTFIQMGISLYNPQASPVILDLSAQLIEIGSETPKGNALLEELVEKIKSKNTPELTMLENLLINQIRAHGKFLLLPGPI